MPITLVHRHSKHAPICTVCLCCGVSRYGVSAAVLSQFGCLHSHNVGLLSDMWQGLDITPTSGLVDGITLIQSFTYLPTGFYNVDVLKSK